MTSYILRNFKSFIYIFGIIILVLVALIYSYFSTQNRITTGSRAAGEQPTPKNVIYILVDDMPPWMVNINGKADNPWIADNNASLEQQDSAWYNGGNYLLKTPNIEGLANSGILFNNVYNTLPQCKASRASLTTGKMPFINGVTSNSSVFDKNINPSPLPKILSGQGFFTALIGKCHLGDAGYEDEGDANTSTASSNYPNFLAYDSLGYTYSNITFPDQGLVADWYNYQMSSLNTLTQSPSSTPVVETVTFNETKQNGERYTPVEIYLMNYITDRAIEVINDTDSIRQGKPFFLHVSYLAPHPPHLYRNIPAFNLLGDQKDNPDATLSKDENVLYNNAFSGGRLTDVNSIPLRNLNLYQNMNFSILPGQLENSVPHRRYLRDQQESGNSLSQKQLLVSYEMMENVDVNIGKLIQALKDKGIYNDTMVIFLSDNGAFYSEHQMTTKGPTLYEEMVRTPLVMNYPAAGGQWLSGKSEALISTLDLPSTILDVLGIAKPSEFQGISFAEILNKTQTKTREGALIQYADQAGRSYPMRGIVTSGGYKFIHFLESTVEGGYLSNFGISLDQAYYNGSSFEFYDLKNDPFEQHNLLPYQNGDTVNNNPLQRALTGNDTSLKLKLRDTLREFAEEQTRTADPNRVSIIGVNIVQGNDRFTITWNTDKSSNTGVTVTEQNCVSGNCLFEYINLELTTNHIASITGLKPGTNYLIDLYSIGGNGNGGHSHSIEKTSGSQITPTFTPTPTPSLTPTPTPSFTPTPTPAPSVTSTLTPTLTNTPTPTPPTPTATQGQVTPTFTQTPTLKPTSTKTPTPTNTPVPIDECTRRPEGDANCDDEINVSDYDCFKAEISSSALASCSTSDFDDDGEVSLLDFVYWKLNSI